MGSFDMLCSISGLPITYGTKVRYFLLTKGDNRLGAISDYQPRTFPLKGKYGDYGKVKCDDDIFLKLWLKGFGVDLIPQELGENEYHDLPTSVDMSFEQLQDALGEKRVIVRRDHRNEDDKDGIVITECIVREDVWQAMLNLKIGNEWTEIPKDFEKLKVDVLEFYNEYIASEYSNLVKWSNYIAISLDPSYRVFTLIDHLNLFHDMNPNKDQIDELANTIAEHIYVNLIMEMLHIRFKPSTYGGQESRWNMRKDFNAALNNIIEESLKEELDG